MALSLTLPFHPTQCLCRHSEAEFPTSTRTARHQGFPHVSDGTGVLAVVGIARDGARCFCTVHWHLYGTGATSSLCIYLICVVCG